MALRALDDIKESVRQAALSLARAVRSMSLRLVDQQQSGAAGGCGVVLCAVCCLLPAVCYLAVSGWSTAAATGGRRTAAAV